MMTDAPRATMTVIGLLALVLLAETGASYPNFIPFFNIAARNLPGARGGLLLLSDSNLDWGQDLPLLAEWQRHHEDRPLYFSYFGTADPAAYGIRYVNLPFGYVAGPPEVNRMDPVGYLAVSATNLQGTLSGDFYRGILDGDPLLPENVRPKLLTILGGSIYIYEWVR